MTELKRSLDRALSGVEFRPENRRRVRLAVFSEQRATRAVRQETLAAKQRRPKAMKWDASATWGGVPTSGRPEAPQTRRKLSTALVVALIASLILMAVAVAAVVTRGFGWYAKQTEDPAGQYNLNELDKRATVAGVQRTASTEGAQKDAVRFEVTQAYYDGSRIDIAYTLSAPDHHADATWRPAAEELNAMEFTAGYNAPAFDDPVANRQMERDYHEQGVCGLHIHSYRIGENLKVAGVPCPGWDAYDLKWTDGMISRYQVLDQLPAKARNRDSVEMTFNLTEYDLYYYQNQTGYYYRIVNQTAVPMAPVVVPRGKGETVYASASKAFETYRLFAKASVSPIETTAFVCQVLPDDWVVADPWTREDDLKGVDYIKEYRLYANGSALESWLSGEGNGLGRLEGEVPSAFRAGNRKKLYVLEITAQGVPEGTKEIRLRPVYSISGERPEEDVVLKIPD